VLAHRKEGRWLTTELAAPQERIYILVETLAHDKIFRNNKKKRKCGNVCKTDIKETECWQWAKYGKNRFRVMS